MMTEETRPNAGAVARVHGHVVTWVGSTIARVLSVLGTLPIRVAVALVATLVAGGWLIVYLAGGADYAPPHWFYFPILVAATRLGIPGIVATAITSGVVAGPLMPADVSRGLAQTPSDEIVRGAFFLVIGLLMAAVIWRLKESLARESEVAAHKAAVISTVSHEFRTPLSVLLGSSRMLLHQEGWGDYERTLLEGIEGSAVRMNELVEAVLAVSEGVERAEELTMTQIPLADVVSAVATGTAPRDSGRISVDVGRFIVRTDPPVLQTILRHLTENALRFSPAGSPVVVTASAVQEEPGLVEIVVADRGPGIDAAFLPRAFEAFSQGDGSRTRTAGGLGIGLFVSRRLADSLGARLELRPRPGGGTEAAVTLAGTAGVSRHERQPEGAAGSSVSRASDGKLAVESGTSGG